MYIVGIDIAKRKHEAAVIDGEGTVIIKPFSFTNNCSGYNRLLAMLTKAKLPLDEVSFAMEATGHYWLALFTRLQKEGFRVQVINPVQTNSIRSFYIRQAKTDPRDALLIAEVIRFGHFSESTLHPENIYELRELCRGRHAIVSMQADVKRKVVALLDQVFPEYETAFTNMFGDTSMAILQTCPTPKELSEMRLEELCHLIEVSSHKRFRMAKAQELQALARNSFGFAMAGDVFSTMIRLYAKHLDFLKQQVREMDRKIAEIMDTPVTIDDAPDAVPLQPGPGAIRFENVSFEYPDDHNKVLHDVSLDIRAGERLALVGASGGGKTTLCNLIPRFYEVTSGRILIDGQDIRRVTLKSLRQDIGIVQQDVYLFSGTVAQNIAYGKPGATREEIMEAARLAGAEKFILALKDGFDTYVGERGVKLSGGQKQRIAIAGVLAMKPECIVLDEATAMLDPIGRREVLAAVEKLNREQGITVVLITHHMNEAEHADRVIVMNDGLVVMDGKPRRFSPAKRSWRTSALPCRTRSRCSFPCARRAWTSPWTPSP